MITTSDINKLKTVFATKDDLRELRQELKQELKEETKKQSVFLVEEITNVISTLGEGIQNSLNQIKVHRDILKQHEHRLDKLENKIISNN